MLDDMEDLQAEMENGLGQEIGEECGDKYGRVERLHIDTEGRRVFIKFTDQVSALRVCVSHLCLSFSLYIPFIRKHSVIYLFAYSIIQARKQRANEEQQKQAVNALDGRIFAGNAIVPQYYDPDKFERRVYE
jgi:splicing factor 45